MPLPVISDGYYVAYRFTLLSSQSAETTCAVTKASTTAAAVADDMKDAWDGTIRDAQTTGTTLVSIAVTALDGTAAAVVVPYALDGANTNDTVTDSLSAIVTLRTGIAGRSNRGRMYWPGMGVEGLGGDGFSWSSSFIAGFQSAVDSWHSAMAATDETLGVLSRKLSSFREVTQLEARSNIGTQRRRLTGGIIF